MSEYKAMVSGYEIETPRRFYRDVPKVILHKLGSAEQGFLTPAEARALAGELVKAAAAAERDL